MKSRLCGNEIVEVYDVSGDGAEGPVELAKAIKNLIKGLDDYSWVNVDWIVSPEDGQYSAVVYVHRF